METNGDEEEEDTLGGAVMALLWFGLLDAVLLTVLIGYIVGFVIAAQKGTFSLDQLQRLLPWLVILAIVAFFVSWVTIGAVRNLISAIKKRGNKNSGEPEKSSP
ncbi:MAG: hypothetical protein V3V98_06120 [Thermoplasmata archaeon]